jgi:CheY-like chemotaxis protein
LEAVEVCLQQNIDLVLMDIQMPKLNGYEASAKIKENNPEISIIVQTAFATQKDKQKTLRMNIDDYISKPIVKDLLLSKMAKYLNA